MSRRALLQEFPALVAAGLLREYSGSVTGLLWIECAWCAETWPRLQRCGRACTMANRTAAVEHVRAAHPDHRRAKLGGMIPTRLQQSRPLETRP